MMQSFYQIYLQLLLTNISDCEPLIINILSMSYPSNNDFLHRVINNINYSIFTDSTTIQVIIPFKFNNPLVTRIFNKFINRAGYTMLQ